MNVRGEIAFSYRAGRVLVPFERREQRRELGDLPFGQTARGKNGVQIEVHASWAAKKNAYLERISRTRAATCASMSSVRTDSTTGSTSSAKAAPRAIHW